MNDRLLQWPAGMVFVYPQAVEECLLVEGLTRALERFPVFAGRLRADSDSLEIVCDNSGLSFSSAALDATLAAAFGSIWGGDAPWLLEGIDPAKARAGHEPLLTVRVSYPSDGGMVVGCCFHHSVGDVSSFLRFMRAWSAAVEGEEIEATVIVEDLRCSPKGTHLCSREGTHPAITIFPRRRRCLSTRAGYGAAHARAGGESPPLQWSRAT